MKTKTIRHHNKQPVWLKIFLLIKNDINKCWQECRANRTLNSMPEEGETDKISLENCDIY